MSRISLTSSWFHPTEAMIFKELGYGVWGTEALSHEEKQKQNIKAQLNRPKSCG